jgi:hypothetical protein
LGTTTSTAVSALPMLKPLELLRLTPALRRRSRRWRLLFRALAAATAAAAEEAAGRPAISSISGLRTHSVPRWLKLRL